MGTHTIVEPDHTWISQYALDLPYEKVVLDGVGKLHHIAAVDAEKLRKLVENAIEVYG